MSLAHTLPTLSVAIVSRALPDNAWLAACLSACAPHTCLLMADAGLITVDIALIDGADADALTSVARYAANSPVVALLDEPESHREPLFRQAGAAECLIKQHLTSERVAGCLKELTGCAPQPHAEDSRQARFSASENAQGARRILEQAALYETMLALNRQQDLTTLLQTILQRSADLLHAPIGALYLTHPNGVQLELAAAHNFPAGFQGLTLQIGEGLAGKVLQTGQKLLVNDYAVWQGQAAAFAGAPIHRIIGVPMQADNHTVGVLDISDNRPGAFSPDDILLISLFAEQAALAVQKARLLDESQRHAHELSILMDVSTALGSAATIDQISAIVLQRGLEMIGGVVGVLALVEADSGVLVRWAGYPPDLLPVGHQQAADTGILGLVIQSGQLYMTANVQADPHCRFAVFPADLPSMNGLITIPLRTDTEVVGALQLAVAEERLFSEGEVRLLTALADMAGSAFKRALVMETLEQRVQERNRELEARYRELAEAHERLQELDRLKGQFVADVTHELRTPVTALGLHLDLVERGKPEKRAQYLATMRLEVERLKQLVLDVLKLSRWDMGRASVALDRVDFNRLVTQEVALLLPRAEAAGTALEFEPDGALPQIWGESAQLSELVHYLVVNALQHTPAGRVEVRTFFEPEPYSVGLVVADTGTGIAPADLPHLFDRFYRGNNGGTLPGSGLGLTIAKEIVGFHQGFIQVESELGRGTQFKVRLPIDRPNTGA